MSPAEYVPISTRRHGRRVTDVRTYLIPADLFAAFARGGGGAPGVALLSSAQRSRQLLALRAILNHGGEGESAIVRACELLVRMQRTSDRAAAAVERILAYPGVMAWANSTLRALGRGEPQSSPDYLMGAAVAAAMVSGTPTEAYLPVVHGQIVLPSLGTVRVAEPEPEPELKPRLAVAPGQAAETELAAGVEPYHANWARVRTGPTESIVEISGTALRIPHPMGRAGRFWRPFRRIDLMTRGLAFQPIADDGDDFSFPGWGHSRSELSDHDLRRWHAVLGQAWSLLVHDHEEAAREVAALISVLVPVARRGGEHTSATSADAFGAVAMSEVPDARAVALVLCHEVQHVKLNGLIDLVPLVHDSGEARWYAPWHDEPRPSSALLQGAYAFLGVAGFWNRTRRTEPNAHLAHRAHTEFARWRDQTYAAVRTLRRAGVLTTAGRTFVDHMADLLRAWRGEEVPAGAVRQARQDADLHRQRWLADHGP